MIKQVFGQMQYICHATISIFGIPIIESNLQYNENKYHHSLFDHSFCHISIVQER